LIPKAVLNDTPDALSIPSVYRVDVKSISLTSPLFTAWM
jgi:hypothetical protein